MEINREDIQLIEQYLEGSLSPSQLFSVKERMASDSIFADLVTQQQQLTEAIQRTGIKTALVKGYQHFLLLKVLKVGFLTIASVVTTASITYFALHSSKKTAEKPASTTIEISKQTTSDSTYRPTQFQIVHLDGTTRDGFLDEADPTIDLRLDANTEPTSTGTLFQPIQPRDQRFVIDPTKPKTLQCKGGVIIEIPAYAFNTKENVSVHVKEYIKPSDMVLAGLTTTSGNDLLVSNGMLHINAKSPRGNSISLASGKKITYKFPKVKGEDYALFTGHETPDDIIDWELENPKTEEREEITMPAIASRPLYSFSPPKPNGDKKQFLKKWNRFLKKNLPANDYETLINSDASICFTITNDGRYKNIEIINYPFENTLSDVQLIKKFTSIDTWFPGRMIDPSNPSIFFDEEPTKPAPRLGFVTSYVTLPFNTNVQYRAYPDTTDELYKQYTQTTQNFKGSSTRYSHKLTKKPEPLIGMTTFVNRLEMFSSTIFTPNDKNVSKQREAFASIRVYPNGSISFEGIDYHQRTKINDSPLITHEKKIREFIISLGKWKPAVNDICEDTIPTLVTVQFFKPRRGKRIKVTNLKPCELNRRIYEKALAKKNKISAANAEYYVFETGNLGWINCDRFYLSSEKQTLELITKNDVHVFGVFTDMKSIIRASTINDKHIIPNIPKNKSLQLISFYSKNNKTYVAMKKVMNDGKRKELSDFQEVTLAELKAIVKTLDN